MMKTKTASVRLPKEMFEEIDNICDGVGCSRNEWIKDKLREGIREETNENSQEQENSPGPDDNTTPKEITVKDIPDEEPKPKVEKDDIVEGGILEIKNPVVVNEPKPYNPPATMRYINGQWRPYATRYEV